ncbi:MAG: hypothetical protein OXC26_01360 [Albidovulum sp.]|nr:hypothetical protein [Albidovulum sp.]
MGYVVIVIEKPAERRETLRRAWALAEQVLAVSTRLSIESKSLRESTDHADGHITSRGTFQKFFEQQELRRRIDSTPGAAPAVLVKIQVFDVTLFSVRQSATSGKDLPVLCSLLQLYRRTVRCLLKPSPRPESGRSDPVCPPATSATPS